MRKTIFLICLIFAISLASARSISITVDETEVAAHSEISINYAISFDEVESFSYQIGIKGPEDSITLLEKEVTSDEESGTVRWDTLNYPAGKYEAFIFIHPTTYWPSRSFNILPFMDFSITPSPKNIYVYEKEALAQVLFNNTGNVPLFVSASLRGLKTQAVLSPLTAEVGVNQSRNFLISVSKPEEHYNATMTFEVSWDELSHETEIPVRIYNPVVLIELENIVLEKEEEKNVFSFTILNKGNVEREIDILVKLQESKHEETIMILPDESLDMEYNFTEKVSYLQLSYIGTDGREKVITENFDFLGGLKLPSIGISENMIYLAIALGLLFVMLYMIKKGKDSGKKG